MNSYQFANYFNEGSINGGGKAIFDEDTMERIQQYMNGEITTSTIANAMVTGNSMKKPMTM